MRSTKVLTPSFRSSRPSAQMGTGWKCSHLFPHRNGQIDKHLEEKKLSGSIAPGSNAFLGDALWEFAAEISFETLT